MGGDYHEPYELLDDAVRDRHRALLSLQEELEAVDWYDQRASMASDDELKAVLAHNGNEEKEHAAMVLEWLRRRDPGLDAHLRTYLFTDRPVTDIEDEPEEGTAANEGLKEGDSGPKTETGAQGSGERGLGIGSLRSARTTTSSGGPRWGAGEGKR